MSEAHVSKGEFAQMVRRSPAAISNWIRDGKLSGDALVGEGNRARINVAVALGQLGLSLDLGQQLAQPEPILLPETPVATSPDLPAPLSDAQKRLAEAKAAQAELDLSVSQAEAAQMEGRWVETTAAQEAWSRELSGIWRSVETWLVTGAASDIAAMDVRDARSVGTVLKSGFRALRQRIADAAASPAPADMQPAGNDEADEEADEED